MEDKWAGLCFLAPCTAYCSVGICVNLKFLPKCVILHHKGLCFNFQHLDLPTFRPALYCCPCWSTSYDAWNHRNGGERMKSAYLHLSRMALLVNLYFPYVIHVFVCVLVTSLRVFNRPMKRNQIGCLFPVSLSLYGPNVTPLYLLEWCSIVCEPFQHKLWVSISRYIQFYFYNPQWYACFKECM